MNIEYILVQAGGKGTRLGRLTKNKPKCLVPVDNRPMIFHLFDRFPQAKFVIIGDYLFDVLDRYLYAFADVKYFTVKTGEAGTCAGIGAALECIPSSQPFMLIWSDLNLKNEGDLWDIVPCNSTSVYLILLQGIAIQLGKKLQVTLNDFKENHPGGKIGEILKQVQK